MCVMCALAGKPAGSPGCEDAGTALAGDGGAKNAAAVGNDGSTFESSGADSVAGSTATTSTIANQTAVRGFINSAGDQDWYRVDLVAGHQYTFAANAFGQGAIADPYLYLYNGSGGLIASDDDSGPLAGALLHFTASTSGTYYIAAAGYGSATGQYMLTMNDGASTYTPTVSMGDIADYLTHTYWEANGTTARHWGSSTITFNVQGLQPERAALARLAFQTWSDAANLHFVETTGSAQIMLDDNQSGAFSSSVVSGGLITSSTVNVDSGWYGGIDAVDSYTLQTFIHEIGHAIGLGHAGPYNGSATYGVDNVYANDIWQSTVMSYMPQSNDGATYRFTMSPMMADIMAVQQIYGAATTRAGDTVYGFGSTAGSLYDFSTYSQSPALTIYDSGGNDTLNASGYSQNQVIDLRPGDFSDLGGLIGNVGIYVTTVIENAIGGSGNDTIYGNDANNTITGRAGNDTIDGGAGIDTAVFSGVRAAYTLTALGGTGVRVVGPDGTDTLTNVERLAFSDQTITWPLTNSPDLHAQNVGLSTNSLQPGGSTTVSYTVINVGSASAASSTVGIYLSTDNVLDGGDTLLTTRATPSLAAGASFSDSIAVTPPSGGSFYVFVVADYNHAVASDPDASNNAATGMTLSVVGPLNLTGGPGDDNLTGGPVNDTLSGMGGNDWLTGGAGDDRLDGGAGDDTAAFSQSLASYSVQDLGSRITLSGPDGNDTLLNIEHLHFADGTVNVVDGSALFDTLFYDHNNADVFHAGVDPLAHYMTAGWHEGRDPNPYFDTSWYLTTNPDVRAAGVNPLEQYHTTGWREGRDPGPDFDTKLYLAHNPDVAAAGVDPLEHYLTSGRAEGRQAYAAVGMTTNGFDAQWYLMHNPDVAAAGVDPYQHYMTSGWKEGRNPNPYFDTAGYLAHNPDIAAAGVNPLLHFEQAGWREGRNPSANFDVHGYLLANPDVASAHVNPLDHYLTSGLYEGRVIVNDGLWHS